MSNPVVFQGLDQFGHGAFLFVEHQIFNGQKGIHGGGKGNGFQRGETDLGPALGDIQALFGATFDQTTQVGRGRIRLAGIRLLRTDPRSS
jgi:hypothetical protein